MKPYNFSLLCLWFSLEAVRKITESPDSDVIKMWQYNWQILQNGKIERRT